MELFCSYDFHQAYHKLKKNNSYREIESLILKHFFDKTPLELCEGTLLNNRSEVNPYIKKRLKGSGGFRVYYYLYFTDGKLFLLFVHPKSGSMGVPNIDDAFKAQIIKKLPEAIKNKEIYNLSKDKSGKKIIFTKQE